MKRYLVLLAVAVVGTLAFTPAASAQSGRFVGKPTCTDIGVSLMCTGKVGGLGGTTFRVEASAAAVADVECTNPGGEVAAGQSFATDATGTSFNPLTATKRPVTFQVGTDVPSAPPGSCPNPMWEARVIDLHFTNATLTLFADSTAVDTITVPVS
jgi:hypothetical protein